MNGALRPSFLNRIDDVLPSGPSYELTPRTSPRRVLEFARFLDQKRGRIMVSQRHTAEQIISKLREAEVLLAKGVKIAEV